jgi:hypothetical protein
MAEVERVVADIAHRHTVVDALVLCANRPSPRRRETVDGLEDTFALYYLSRYLLGVSFAERAARGPWRPRSDPSSSSSTDSQTCPEMPPHGQ